MGFRDTETVYTLTFEDPKLEGLEVRVREPSADAHLTVSRHFALMAELREPSRVRDLARGGLTSERLDELTGIYRALASALESWNLETEDGTPVPATFEGLMSRRWPLALKVVNAWVVSVVNGWVAEIADGSGSDSGGGQPATPATPAAPAAQAPGRNGRRGGSGRHSAARPKTASQVEASLPVEPIPASQ